MQMDWYGWGMGGGWLFMALFWVLVIAGVVYLIKVFADRSRTTEKGDTALDILKKRYAGGEITREEFERIREDLLKK